MPKVSIIMPTYNGEKYIAETIESVLNQTFKDFEIIIVDDGSIDETAKIINLFISKNPEKIKYIYQKNKGVAAARNRGIKEAAGEFIAFIDHDDLWMPNKLDEQLLYFSWHPGISLVFSNSIEFGDKANNKPVKIYEGNCFLELLKENFIPALSVLVKKEVFNLVGLLDEDLNMMGCDDYDMWLRIAYKYKIGYVDKFLVRWRADSGGFTYSKHEKMINARLNVVKKNLQLAKTFPIDYKKFARGILSSHYASIGYFYLSFKKIKKARIEFGKAFTYDIFNLKALLYFLILIFVPSFILERIITFKNK